MKNGAIKFGFHCTTINMQFKIANFSAQFNVLLQIYLPFIRLTLSDLLSAGRFKFTIKSN
jgi:hypothetical protein